MRFGMLTVARTQVVIGTVDTTGAHASFISIGTDVEAAAPSTQSRVRNLQGKHCVVINGET